jgi:superfamily I DNA/RNA helicase
MRPDPDHDAVRACTATHQVVVAPPGTGKTYLAVGLAASWTRSLDAHRRVLLLTFSNQARAQLEREAARQVSRNQRALIEVTNYHRLFWQSILAYRRLLALPERISIVPEVVRRRALEAKLGKRVVKALYDVPGAIEALGERQFDRFRDPLAPGEETLDSALEVVKAEQRAGRLIFGDFGALFWELMTHSPVLHAYRLRFPMVIADEHQDASSLQDEVVRLLGIERLVIFADPMQTIHAFRGADEERLSRHVEQAEGAVHELRTPHRWYASKPVGEWLLSVRGRLSGDGSSGRWPSAIRLCVTAPEKGRIGMITRARHEVRQLRRAGAETVAVLARDSALVASTRDSFCRNKVYPRQVGGSDDFEAAHAEVELLASAPRRLDVARHVASRLSDLVPSLERPVVQQIFRRLHPHEVRLVGCSERAQPFLEALHVVYSHGPSAYFHALSQCLEAASRAGHHIPRRDALKAIREAASETKPTADTVEILAVYETSFQRTQHAAPRPEHGVFVMTAHQAKGKEFDAVVLLGADRSSFPDNNEARNLLYVALTRATRSWVVIHPQDDRSPLLDLVL